LDGLERARLHEGGYLTSRTRKNGDRRAYDVSLAVSLGNAADRVPDELARKMREVAAVNDAVFAEIQAGQAESAVSINPEELWSNAYGSGARVGRTNVYMLRYRQCGGDAYRQAILQDAIRYRDQEINLTNPVWPGTVGDAVWLMLNAYELTGRDRYLQAANRFTQKGVELFLADNPLPRASHLHNHYEAVTNGDTFMMALLQLWVTQNRPDLKVKLVYVDR
jgi:hypothetical protein